MRIARYECAHANNIIIKYGFYLFIFLLPWQTRLIWQEAFFNGYDFEYGRLSLYGTEIILALVLLAYGIWLVKSQPIKKIDFRLFIKRLKDPPVYIYWLVVLFLIFLGLSSTWALDARLAFYTWIHWLEAGAMLSLILIFDIKLTAIAVCWVAAAGLQGVFGLWQFFNQDVFASKWLGLAQHYPALPGAVILDGISGRWLRAYGSLPHPNILGGYLALAVLWLLYLALKAEKRNQRIFVLTSLLAIMPALLFTFSRSAWLALAITLALFAIFLWRQKNLYWQKTFFKVIFLLVLITVICTASLSDLFFARLAVQQRVETESIRLRVEFGKQALMLIKSDWLSGTGIGNYTLGVIEKINNTWPGYYYQPVHNIYLLALAELGVFGALIFCLILFLLIYHLLRSRLTLEKAISFLCLLSILIIGIFDHYFWTLYFGIIIFWLILALNLKQLKPQKGGVDTP